MTIALCGHTNSWFLISHRRTAHGEGQEISEGGDGDGGPGPSHGQPEPLRHRQLLLLTAEIVEALHCHEHVIDS